MVSHLSLDEVLRSVFDDDEDSDGDFSGYIDEDSGNEEDGEEEHVVGEGEGEIGVGEECSMGEQTVTECDGSTMVVPDYILEKGCTHDMSDKSPIDFFGLLVTDNMLTSIVEQTNLYAQQFMADHNLGPRSRVQQWDCSPHTLSELKKFLALLIGMGLISLPKIEDHWVTTWPFATSAFSGVMSRDRFSLVMKFIHLNDNTRYIPKGQPGYDALYKIRPFLEPLHANFQSCYTMGREISVDESMVSYKGRLSFLQYLPNKPNKWGMKAYVLADSLSGYTYKWRLYTGKHLYTCE